MQNIDFACELFNRMPQILLISWFEMIAKSIENGQVEKVLEDSKQMQLVGVKPISPPLPASFLLRTNMEFTYQRIDIRWSVKGLKGFFKL